MFSAKNLSVKQTTPDAKSQSTSSSEQVLAVKYTVVVCEGVMDYIHGGGHGITEIFIPSHKICFNEQAIFKSDKARATQESQVSLSKDLVENIEKVANLTEQLKTEKSKLTANNDYQSIFDEPTKANTPKK